MTQGSACIACPKREHGFCGALLEEPPRVAPLLQRPSWQDFQRARPNEDIVVRGELCDYVHVLCNGWAFRFFRLADGSRQILNFLLPGDLFSAVSAFDERFGFSVQALTDVQFSRFRRAEVRARLAANPAISEELAKACVVEHNHADELLTALGRCSAEERIAYLFLHLMKRIAARNVIREHRCPFPLRQQHIAEITGLTPVHVNRVMGALRGRGIVELSGGYLTVLDQAELERLGSLR
jgi:CRP/FNR family transcriptional regulator